MIRRFVACIKNEGYEASLERNKIYRVKADPDAAKDGDIRVVDESGEDYLYPAVWFTAVEISFCPRSTGNTRRRI